MNDYFLQILIRQRHEEILAEFRAAQLSKLGRLRVIPSKKSLRRLGSFFSRCKSAVAFKPPGGAERKTS